MENTNIIFRMMIVTTFKRGYSHSRSGEFYDWRKPRRKWHWTVDCCNVDEWSWTYNSTSSQDATLLLTSCCFGANSLPHDLWFGRYPEVVFSSVLAVVRYSSRWDAVDLFSEILGATGLLRSASTVYVRGNMVSCFRWSCMSRWSFFCFWKTVGLFFRSLYCWTSGRIRSFAAHTRV